MTTLLLNQSLWFNTDLSSASPRSFVYPLLLAFFYYVLRKSWLIVALILILEAFFYPLLIFISTGILCLRLRRNYFLLAAMLLIVFFVMLPYALSSSEYGPVVTGQKARQMLEHWPGGRHPFFDPNPLVFWLMGQHSGILPPLMPPLIWSGLFLPWLIKRTSFLPLLKLINKNNLHLLSEILLVSFSFYVIAHAVFLKLFFPTRYTVHTLRIIMAVAAGILLTAILHKLRTGNGEQGKGDEEIDKSASILLSDREHKIENTLPHSPSPIPHTPSPIPHSLFRVPFFKKFLISFTLLVILLFYPNFLKNYPKSDYRIGTHAELYRFLLAQPKDSLSATLSDEADNLPTFSKRATLTAREYALPFHLGYYSQIRQRTIDLIEAQYSQDLTPAKKLIQKYGVDFWLLERSAFQAEYLNSKSWLQSFQPAFTQALSNLQTGKTPALTTVVAKCSVFQTNSFTVLEASCITKQ